MNNPAYCVVDDLGRGEGLMAALMSQDPETGTEETLHEGVRSPQCNTEGLGRDIFWGDEVIVDGEDGGQAQNIPEDISKTSDGGPLEAVRWNGIANLLDC